MSSSHPFPSIPALQHKLNSCPSTSHSRFACHHLIVDQTDPNSRRTDTEPRCSHPQHSTVSCATTIFEIPFTDPQNPHHFNDSIPHRLVQHPNPSRPSFPPSILTPCLIHSHPSRPRSTSSTVVRPGDASQAFECHHLIPDQWQPLPSFLPHSRQRHRHEPITLRLMHIRHAHHLVVHCLHLTR